MAEGDRTTGFVPPRDTASLVDQAAALRALHRPRTPLVLPNAWDAASARLVVTAGYPVVATTSSGVAESLGYADGQQIPPAEMFAALARIARAVAVPVTADLEGGYGLAPDSLVAAMLEAGAVGLNFEDTDHARPGTMLDADVQADRIAQVRQAAQAAGVDIVINARVDVFLRWREAAPADRVTEAVRRARAYLAAGADCVYPILAGGEETIAALVRQIDGPVNMMLHSGSPDLGRLAALGVARVSLGGELYAAAQSATAAALDRLRLGEFVH